MSKILRTLILTAAATLSSGAMAAGYSAGMAANPAPAPVAGGSPPPASDNYGDTIRLKLASGIANMATGFVEVPKNMINTANNTTTYGSAFDRGGYVLWGITGGGLKGAMHMLGRTLAGLFDFATFYIPTKPTTNPPFVWQNFYSDTQYGPYVKVESTQKPVTSAPGKK